MPIQRAYNVWKTGIILTVKKYEHLNPDFPWCVIAISKTIWERDKIFCPLKIFSKFKTYKEAKDSIPEIQKTINKYKFPR